VLGEIAGIFKARSGDLLLFVADDRAKCQKVLGALRLWIARWKIWSARTRRFILAGITEFPLFKWNEEDKRWDSEHHPFTSPDIKGLGENTARRRLRADPLERL